MVTVLPYPDRLHVHDLPAVRAPGVEALGDVNRDPRRLPVICQMLDKGVLVFVSMT
jgi:hypothetical protein